MGLDAAVGFCALFLPWATSGYLSVSLTLPSLAKGLGSASSGMRSLANLVGSNSSLTSQLEGLSTIVLLMVIAIVASVCVDLYRDYSAKTAAASLSGIIALFVVVVVFFGIINIQAALVSSLSGYLTDSIAAGILTSGIGLWTTAIAGAVSAVMHVRQSK